MFTRPGDLGDADVASALEQGWQLEVEAIDYAPVGFGSHHWRVPASGSLWFVTVDDLSAKLISDVDTIAASFGRLEAALGSAVAVRDAGLDFVVAPVAAADETIVQWLGDRFAIALYPAIAGESGEFGPFTTSEARNRVVDLLGQLHEVGAPSGLHEDSLVVPKRGRLEKSVAECAGDPSNPSWGPGPFAQPARQLLRQHGAAVLAALRRYDELAAGAARRSTDWVMTHGEPHPGNVMTVTSRDAPRVLLIDWDTARRAPRERDLWRLVDEDPSVLTGYEQQTGVKLDAELCGLYRLWWDLCEVSLYIDDLRRSHADNADTRTAWAALQVHLDPRRWAT